MNCQDYERLINKKLDRSLSPREASLLEAHLAACPACARMAEEYLLLDQLLAQNIAQVNPPADLCSSVMAALPEGQLLELESFRSKAKHRRSPAWRWAGGAVAAAAVALGFLVGSWFEQSQPGTELSTPPIQAEQEQPEQAPELQKPFRPARENQQTPDQEEALPVVAEQPDADASQPPQQQDPVNTEAPVEADPTEAPVTDPPAVEEAPVDVNHNNEFSLPPVAYGNSSQGDYNLLTLAAVEGYDAKLPLVKGSTVSFYVETEDAYLEYQVEISGAEPQFLGETESLPSAKATAGCESMEEGSGVEASSANGQIAQNRGGEEPGLWLLNADEESKLTEIGGGALLSWSADGNKILFTDTEEHLHIYYVAENILLNLNAAPVHSFCWGSDGRSIVFSALDAETGYYSIFTVIVP